MYELLGSCMLNAERSSSCAAIDMIHVDRSYMIKHANLVFPSSISETWCAAPEAAASAMRWEPS